MLPENVIITDEKKVKEIKDKIETEGAAKLHVVSDFDKTLTSCFVDGQKIVSLISILRDEHYLTPDYSAKAQALYDKYHPIEIDPNISLGEKKAKMREWWMVHYDLLVKSGLSKDDLKKVTESKKLFLRPGASEFLNFLHERQIPLVILSAAGLGSETISLYLERNRLLYDNIFIASNKFIWDESGKVKGVEEPIIHTFNKDYSSVKKFPFYKNIKDRKNVILLGDGLGDADMIKGFEYDNILKIGFLNEDAENSAIRESFEKAFDILILDDGPMDYLNNLSKNLVYGS